MTEVIIILGLALILLGPDQLPTIAKSIGKGMREIRKATDDLKSTFEQEMVRMDEPLEAPRALSPVTPVAPADGTTPADPNALPVPAPAADPASARAAARRAAAAPRRVASSMDPLSLSAQQQAQLRLVPPAGVVAQGAAAQVASPAAEAPSASASNDASKGTP